MDPLVFAGASWQTVPLLGFISPNLRPHTESFRGQDATLDLITAGIGTATLPGGIDDGNPPLIGRQNPPVVPQLPRLDLNNGIGDDGNIPLPGGTGGPAVSILPSNMVGTTGMIPDPTFGLGTNTTQQLALQRPVAAGPSNGGQLIQDPTTGQFFMVQPVAAPNTMVSQPVANNVRFSTLPMGTGVTGNQFVANSNQFAGNGSASLLTQLGSLDRNSLIALFMALGQELGLM